MPKDSFIGMVDRLPTPKTPLSPSVVPRIVGFKLGPFDNNLVAELSFVWSDDNDPEPTFRPLPWGFYIDRAMLDKLHALSAPPLELKKEEY